MKELNPSRMSQQYPIGLIKHKNIKFILKIIALVVIGFVVIWGRALYGSRQAYQKGEAYLKEKQYIRAVTFFDRSLHWYTPFNPYVQESAQRLWEIGNHAERQGDIKLALIAFRTIRRGFYAASNFIVPGRRWIEKCESKIKKLAMIKEKGREVGVQSSQPPGIFWSIILELGFLGWIGSVICFILFGLRHKGESKYSTSMAIALIGLTIIFFTMWIVGMIKA